MMTIILGTIIFILGFITSTGILCLIEIKELDEVKNYVDEAEQLYEEQKYKMTEKEKNFVEKSIEKIKRKNKRLFK